MANQKIYVRMENDEVCMKFYEWAEHEGLRNCSLC